MFLEQYILYQLDSELLKREKVEEIMQKKEEEILKTLDVLEKERIKLDRKRKILQRKRLEEYEKAVFGREAYFQTKDTDMQNVDGKISEIDIEIDRLKKSILKRKDGAACFFNQGCKTDLKLVGQIIRKITVYDEEHIEIEWMLDIEENAIV